MSAPLPVRFSSLTAELHAHGRSTRAYAIVSELARSRLRTDAARSAGWFLLSVIADRFAERLDELPVASADVDALSRVFEHSAAALDAATSPDELLDALNAVATAHAAG